jgi:hypothetical protein
MLFFHSILSNSKIVFQYSFAYNVSVNDELDRAHPALIWEQEAHRPQQSLESRLRLAAMAGHMRTDQIAARRAALADLLADGRPHARDEIKEKIADQLGDDCWGQIMHEALARDLAALRRGGIRIAYSRRPGISGYYLQFPPLQRPPAQSYGAINWELIERIRQLSVAEKNERAFAAADFALRQKLLILAEEHPDWSAEKVEREARQLLYGVSDELWP